MGKITILSEQLRNQIAAGEVVERPASVVKELIENSIDADSTRIILEIEGGGTEKILISDNGWGMDRKDAELALQRHATSKLKQESDLQNIATMGFRGEALASIASVSDFVLKTKLRGEVEGTQISIKGGADLEIKPVGCSEGTQIEIRNLFFNTPARKKFLKTVSTEYQQILQTLTQLALINPQISFALKKNEKVVFDVPATDDLKERVRSLLGKNIADELIPIFYGGADLKIKGFIGTPRIARSSRKAQYLFVNGRPVQNVALAYIVRNAYGTLLMDGKKPFFLAAIDIDPQMVDVNVHPRKTEVRFVDQRDVASTLRRTCKAALEQYVVAPNVAIQQAKLNEVGFADQKIKSPLFNSGPTRKAEFTQQPSAEVVQGAMGFNQEFSRAQKTSVATFDSPNNQPQVTEDFRLFTPSVVNNDVAETATATTKITPANTDIIPTGLKNSGASLGLSMIPITQVANSYIVAENQDGLVLIDQHAAHERVLFMKFKEAWEKKPLNSQPLLVPLNIELSHQEVALLSDNKAVFAALGFEIDEFGGNTFAINAIPADAAKSNVEKLIIGIIDDLANNRKVKTAEERKIKILEYMACRTAIKFGDPLTFEEMVGLIREMDQTEGIATCPHGRPTTIPLTFYDLEKQFGRHG